jgi:hypothetical protein
MRWDTDLAFPFFALAQVCLATITLMFPGIVHG